MKYSQDLQALSLTVRACTKIVKLCEKFWG